MVNIKTKLHPRNKHRNRYDFKQLIESYPELAKYVKLNKYEDESVDFFDPKAVKALNKALLKHYYDIKYWDVPQNYLTPPIPGRADYIHYVADLLAGCNNGKIPTGKKVLCLDIGVGASCIYPIIGNKEYGWSFIGSDIDTVSLESASKIIESDVSLKEKVELRLQPNTFDIFNGIIKNDEFIDITVCNPPFHASLAEALKSTRRKVQNLKHKKINKPVLNFGGDRNELWCVGGELAFVRNMIVQSKQFANSCMWFTTLISKESNLKNIYKSLKKAGTVDVRTIPMGQGNKKSRIVAWTFLSKEDLRRWTKKLSKIHPSV